MNEGVRVELSRYKLMLRALRVIDGAVNRRLVMALLLVVSASVPPAPSRVMAASGGNAAAGQSAQQATLKPASATTAMFPSTTTPLPPNSSFWSWRIKRERKPESSTTEPLRRWPLPGGAAPAERFAARQSFASVTASNLPTPASSHGPTRTQLDQEGENVALDYDAEKGHEHLMLSPPHRANLLNPEYKVIGLGVVRSGDRLYIVRTSAMPSPIIRWRK